MQLTILYLKKNLKNYKTPRTYILVGSVIQNANYNRKFYNSTLKTNALFKNKKDHIYEKRTSLII